MKAFSDPPSTIVGVVPVLCFVGEGVVPVLCFVGVAVVPVLWFVGIGEAVEDVPVLPQEQNKSMTMSKPNPRDNTVFFSCALNSLCCIKFPHF